MKISNQAISFAAASLVASPFANADTKVLSGNVIRKLKSKVSAVQRFGQGLDDTSLEDALNNLGDDAFGATMDDAMMDDLLGAMFDGLGFDEDTMQCMTDKQDLLDNNPKLEAAEDSMNVIVEDGMDDVDNMDVTMSGGKNKMVIDIDIPQSVTEEGKSACLAAGANFEAISKLNCEGSMLGVDMSMKIKNMAECMPDTDACAGVSSGEMMASLYESFGFECDVRVSGGAGRSWATASYLAGIVAVASAVFGI